MTVVFTLEAVLKMAALGTDGYFCDKFNVFDLSVVVVSLPEIILPEGLLSLTFLKIFRILRLFRSFKVLYKSRHVRHLAKGMGAAMREMVSYVLLLSLFTFISALAGMQLFGGKFADLPEGNPPSNYDDFFRAAMCTLQLVTASKWSTILVDASSALGRGTTLYFVVIVFVGRYVMLQLLTAIFIAKLPERNYLDQYELNLQELREIEKKPSLEREHSSSTIVQVATLQRNWTRSRPMRSLRRDQRARHLYGWLGDHARSIVQWHWPRFSFISFDGIVLFCVLFSVVVLTMQTMDWDAAFEDVLQVADVSLTVLFVVEILLQVLAQGPRAWVSDPWNILDGLIVFVSLLAFAPIGGAGDLGATRGLRTLRVLKPLRTYAAGTRTLARLFQCDFDSTNQSHSG